MKKVDIDISKKSIFAKCILNVWLQFSLILFYTATIFSWISQSFGVNQILCDFDADIGKSVRNRNYAYYNLFIFIKIGTFGLEWPWYANPRKSQLLFTLNIWNMIRSFMISIKKYGHLENTEERRVDGENDSVTANWLCSFPVRNVHCIATILIPQWLAFRKCRFLYIWKNHLCLL
jgi:hypothetical protein